MKETIKINNQDRIQDLDITEKERSFDTKENWATSWP